MTVLRTPALPPYYRVMDGRRYIDQLLDDVRAQLEPLPEVVSEALARRQLVLQAAVSIAGAFRCIESGSLAHGTAICPIHRRDRGLDADGAVVLRQEMWPLLGPETVSNHPPDEVVNQYCTYVVGKVRAAGYSRATAEPTKRAILVRFHQPLPDGEDPSVDLIIALPRPAGGVWIPNLEKHRWDPSDPGMHTLLFNSGPPGVPVTRAQAVRLGKGENKRTDPPALCSFNVEALAWMFLREVLPLPEALLLLWSQGAADLARRLTPDPAGVSAPIKVKDRFAAARRWQSNAQRMEAALRPGCSDAEVQALLHPLWPDYIADDPKRTPAREAVRRAAETAARAADLAETLRTRRPVYAARSGGLALGGGVALKSPRSSGDQA